MRPRPRHPAGQDRHGWSRRRIALVVLGTVVGLFGLTGGALALALRSLEGNVEREQVFQALDEAERPAAETAAPAPAGDDGTDEPDLPLDVLVLGSDTRDDEVGAGLDRAETVEGARADTTLLVHLTAARDAAWVVSIPRDSWVQLPPCRARDGGQLPARDGQFSTAFQDGGVACTVKAVEALTDVRIDHTVVVDFSAFTDMVDALGGVPVCLDQPFQPRKVNIDLPAGRHVLQPREALAFVRARYGVDDGSDLSRIERQKQFMAAMVNRALSRELLVRPDRLFRFLSAATSSLRVDENLDVSDLALSLRGIDPGRVVFSTVPIDQTPGPRFREGGALYGRVRWDEPAADRLFAALEADRVPVPGGAPVTPTTRPWTPPAAPAPGTLPPGPAPAPQPPPPGSTTAGQSPCG